MKPLLHMGSSLLTPTLTALRTAWQQRTPRERQLLTAGAAMLTLALLWSVALAPAWHTWREAPARQAALDTQTRQMQALQAQALALKKPSPITRTEALRWLEDNIASGLGPDAQSSLQGERLHVKLSGTSAEQLATWLSQARERAQALPVQAQLQQTPPGKSATPQEETLRWSGTLVFSLPEARQP